MVIVLVLLLAALAAGGMFSGSTSSLGGGGNSNGGGSSPLVVTDSASQYSGHHPLTVTFSSSVSGGTPPYSYLWNLGFGSTQTTATASDTYTLRGTYSVTLTVTDSTGASKSASPLQITVNPNQYVTEVDDSTTVGIGAGMGGAKVYTFTVPTVGSAPDAVNASISGIVDITACFLCSLSAYTMVVTPSELSTLQSGGSTQVIWCPASGGNCQEEQNVQVNLDLTPYSGQTLNLVTYNTNLLQGETATVVVYVYSQA